MFFKLQNWRSITGGILHYGGMAAVGAAAIGTGQVWTLALGTGIIGGLFAWSLKRNKQIMEEGLVKHPEKHQFSPNLQSIVDKLFKKSGLNVEKTNVYDFKVQPSAQSKYGVLGELIGDMLGKVAMTPNAAAFNLGKPVIMISDPLLELLDDVEEEAVLAHEFAHAAAYHQHVGIPHSIVAGVAKTSNSLALIGQFFSSGLYGIVGGFYASYAAKNLIEAIHPNGHLVHAKDQEDLPPYLHDEPDMKKLHDIKSVKKITALTQAVATTGVVSYFNPLYLPFFATVKGLNLAADYLTKSFSRNKEYQADRGATVLGASPLAMITALRKMSVVQKKSVQEAWGNQKVPEPNFLQKSWKEAFATHPSVPKRINRLTQIARAAGYDEVAINRAVEGPIHVPDTVRIPSGHIVAMAKAFVGNESYDRFGGVPGRSVVKSVNQPMAVPA